MLDDAYDKSGLRKVIEAMPEHVRTSYDYPISFRLAGMPSSIIICGMGGSGIAGQIIAAYAKDAKIRISCVNDYDIPASADKNTLFIISSYSGNTEETLSCYKQATKISENVIVITSGGKLLESAQKQNHPCIQLPKGLAPRNAIAFLFFPILRILEKVAVVENQDRYVKDLISTLTKNSSALDRQARELAAAIDGRIPIVYSSSGFAPIAYRWKTQFNENAKTLAAYHVFPELDHNEINGFYNTKWPLHIIMLKDESDHRRVHKRMAITKSLIKQANPDIKFTEISIKGDDLLTRMFTTIYLGDLTSFYLAMKYATDPAPVEIIERLKKEMGPFI